MGFPHLGRKGDRSAADADVAARARPLSPVTAVCSQGHSLCLGTPGATRNTEEPGAQMTDRHSSPGPTVLMIRK